MAELMIVAMRAEMTMMVSNLKTKNIRKQTFQIEHKYFCSTAMMLRAKPALVVNEADGFPACLCPHDVSLTSATC